MAFLQERLYANRMGPDDIIPLCQPPIPPQRWGQDHWSTLLYVETRWVDHGGSLELDHMRTNSHHPVLQDVQERLRPFRLLPAKDYPTRLTLGEELLPHDDWDCLADLAREGLVRLSVPAAANFSPQLFTAEDIAELQWRSVRCALTAHGARTAMLLRAYRAKNEPLREFSERVYRKLV